MKGTNVLTGLCGVAVLLATVGGGDAAGIRVQCEKRTDPRRSRISVDVKDVHAADGPFHAVVISGNRRKAAPPQNASGDEAEVAFDFDSNPDEVAAGATQIRANFIVNTVHGKILDATGYEVANSTVNCRLR
jgi:hypothetical protein